jgi:hypothetical protein
MLGVTRIYAKESMKSQIQIFLENLLLSILTIGKVILLSRPLLRYPKLTGDHKVCVIMGNGPSLHQTITRHTAFLEDKVLFCVNIFSRTRDYEMLKPSCYVITSPEFWINDAKKGWYEDRYKTFEEIVEKTDWDLNLIVPLLARKDKKWIKFMRKNPHINLIYFNNTPIEGFTWINHLLYNLNLGTPRPHNVLIPSIFIAIKCGFKKIYLAGTDHNWLEDIQVTENNEVLLSQKHFYDKQFKDRNDKNSPHPRPMYHGPTSKKRKLHEVIIKFYYAFRGYWEIQDYAQTKDVEIVNLTMNSYIDAFIKEDLSIS